MLSASKGLKTLKCFILAFERCAAVHSSFQHRTNALRITFSAAVRDAKAEQKTNQFEPFTDASEERPVYMSFRLAPIKRRELYQF